MPRKSSKRVKLDTMTQNAKRKLERQKRNAKKKDGTTWADHLLKKLNQN